MVRIKLFGLCSLIAAMTVPAPAIAATVFVQDHAAQARSVVLRDDASAARRTPAAARGDDVGVLPVANSGVALLALLAGGFAVIMVLRRRKKPPTVIS
jgi:hypothetical protein